MSIKKIVIGIAIAYVGFVAIFESRLGYYQPESTTTLVITTTDANGAKKDRVLRRLISNGKLYVAVNHWPRAWFRRALKNPLVEITMDGETRSYTAVEVDDDEHQQVDNEHGLSLSFRFKTGFPPRYFVRLDPR